ncbi:MAG TPA: hypothetical protein VIV40_05240 [Kofleriaceae bacterium]
MPIASVMADDANPELADPPKIGAKNVAPDEELIKLSRKRPNIRLLTAAGVVFLAVFFLLKLNPDRRFSSNDDTPMTVTVPDLAKGNVDDDKYVSVKAEPLMSHAIRAQTAKNSVGLRVVPIKGSSEKLWIVLPGDGWVDPTKDAYTGRVRKLSDLPFSGVLADFLAAHPRPLFAQPAAVRTGFASSKITTVAGDEITVHDNDKIAFDVTDPNAAIIVAAYNERLPNVAAWTKALTEAGITVAGPGRDDRERVFFDVSLPGAVGTLETKLLAAGLVAARVDPVTHHHETTWRALKASGPAGFTIAGITIPDPQLDLIGMYVVRDLPTDAYAVIVGEHPQDYWYVLPVAILVGLIALVFGWALVRAIKRDLLQPKVAVQS